VSDLREQLHTFGCYLCPTAFCCSVPKCSEDCDFYFCTLITDRVRVYPSPTETIYLKLSEVLDASSPGALRIHIPHIISPCSLNAPINPSHSHRSGCIRGGRRERRKCSICGCRDGRGCLFPDASGRFLFFTQHLVFLLEHQHVTTIWDLNHVPLWYQRRYCRAGWQYEPSMPR
jgi:hypothetical protein